MNTNDYLTKCPCGRTTSKAFAQAHEGLCKRCAVAAIASVVTTNKERETTQQ